MFKNLFKKPKKTGISRNENSADTCHGCKYLEGEVTRTLFFAGCGNGVWEDSRPILLGEVVCRPEKCEGIHERY